MKSQLKKSDNIKVYNFKTKSFDEIIDRGRDGLAAYVILKNGGKLTLAQLDRDYGLAHEAE